MSAKDAANAAERRYNEARVELEAKTAHAFKTGFSTALSMADARLEARLAKTKFASDARIIKLVRDDIHELMKFPDQVAL